MAKKYLDYGCGFPVEIADVRIAKTPIGEIPLIDYALLAREVCGILANKPTRLTGHEVRFLRLHFKLSMEKLGKRLGVTHPAVKRWEATGDQPTKMGWACEAWLRIMALTQVDPDVPVKDISSLFLNERPVGKYTIRIAKDLTPGSVVPNRTSGQCEFELDCPAPSRDDSPAAYTEKPYEPRQTRGLSDGHQLADAA